MVFGAASMIGIDFGSMRTVKWMSPASSALTRAAVSRCRSSPPRRRGGSPRGGSSGSSSPACRPRAGSLRSERERSGSDEVVEVFEAVRHDQALVHAEVHREVGVGGLQLDDEPVTIRPDVGGGIDQRLDDRVGILAPVTVEAVDAVLDGQRLAVVELDALADLEPPRLQVGRRVPLGGEVRLRLLIRRVANDLAADLESPQVVERRVQAVRIQGVVRAVGIPADPHPAALDRRVGKHRIGRGEQGGGGRRGDTGRAESAGELTAGDTAGLVFLLIVLDEFVHYWNPSFHVRGVESGRFEGRERRREPGKHPVTAAAEARIRRNSRPRALA